MVFPWSEPTVEKIADNDALMVGSRNASGSTTIRATADMSRIAQIPAMTARVNFATGSVAYQPPGANVSPNQFAGATQDARIRAAIAFVKAAGGGTVELGLDTVTVPNTSTWLVSSALLVPSNFALYLNHAYLKLANGVFDNIIRNDGIVVNGADPNNVALSISSNHDIKIYGSGVGNSGVIGPDTPYTAPDPILGGSPVPWVGDRFGWRTIGILMANVQNYEIYGFSYSNPTCWSISNEHGCINFLLHDLDFQSTVVDGDGIDLRKGCSYGKIWNITGTTSDDALALTALMFPTNDAGPAYVWPMEVGGYMDSPLGNDIHHIWVGGAHTGNGGISSQTLLFLCGGGSKMHHIYAFDIADTNALALPMLYVLTAFGLSTPAVLGDIHDIYVNGALSTYSAEALHIKAPLLNCNFNFIRNVAGGGSVYSVDPAWASSQSNVIVNGATI